jgi:hypothetical protein
MPATFAMAPFAPTIFDHAKVLSLATVLATEAI